MSEPIDLNHAFPEYAETMHTMRATDAHFGKRYDEYLAIEKELHRIESGAQASDDMHVEGLKKTRLALKDEMSAMLHKAAA